MWFSNSGKKNERPSRSTANSLSYENQENQTNQTLYHHSYQKEKAYNKETKRKGEEMKATISSLRTQKTDLKTKLKGLEAIVASLKDMQKELEASLKERESRISQMDEKSRNLHNTQKELEVSLKERDSRIKQMEEKATSHQNTQKKLETSLKEKDRRINQLEEKATTGSNPDQMAALMEILQQKEAELEEIKTRFQDYRANNRKVVTSKSSLAQTNNGNTRPVVVVAGNVTDSRNTTMPATSEEKRSGNTTITESKHEKQKVRSLEQKQVKVTGNTDDDDLQDGTSDLFLDIDDIYGDNHARKPEFPQRNKKFLTNSHVDNQYSGHSLDQDTERVTYNKLLEKENSKADETKNNSTDGHLEKQSKDSLIAASLNRKKEASKEKPGAADVKPKVPVNDDGTQQQNKKQKKKRSRSKKKMADGATINGEGEVTK